jgi:hypothetical protein
MVIAAFVAPYLLDATTRFVEAAARLPGVQLALITAEPVERVPPSLRYHAAAHWRVDDALDPGQIADAVRGLSDQIGPVERLIGVLEQLQVPLAQVREHLGIDGIDVATAVNFRDKAQMKTVLRAAGVPCARHRLADSAAAAVGFVDEVGFPVVVKPPAGAGARGTFRLESADQLGQWLAVAPPDGGQPAMIEELVVGDELSFDSVVVHGKMLWHSISRYAPTPLTVLEHPWIQWCVLLPREIDGPEYEPIRHAGGEALRALGLVSGFSHMEWFRRADGSVAVSEVGARPPGAQLTTLMSFAHDVDLYAAWARLMVYDELDPPERRWAVGAAYLRPQGHGRIRAVHGVDQLEPALHELVVEARLPQAGQPTSSSYEGDGYVIVRHRDTDVVERALDQLITTIRVELE